MPATDKRDPDHPDEIGAGLPPWATSVAGRLTFFARRDRGAVPAGELAATLDALRRRAAEPGGGDRVLQSFLRACLALLAEQAAARPDLAEAREELEALCGLARIALDGDRDDRPVNARASALWERPGAGGRAAPVAGRVVWLAAMAAVPEEEGAAAAMLVNDLAALGLALPLRALQMALRG